MVSDSITTALIPSVAGNTRNKKKRTNRSAKMKQCKFDARREQWLSQVAVKNKGCKDGGDVHTSSISARKESKHAVESLEMVTPRKNEDNGGSIHQDSDLEFLSNSPNSFNCSVSGGNDSGTNFTGTGSSSSSSSSSGSGGCCSGSITEEEECDDDGCLDDWEALADALATNDKHQTQCSRSVPLDEPTSQMVSDRPVSGMENSKPETARSIQRSSVSISRAWRPDDAFRPQGLPNLSKQYSLPNPERHHGGGIRWACNSAMVAPCSCPICYEDLDLTDSSFLPCLCGFRLCLFCHKRILEDDGRCPGCRKPYESHLIEAETSVHRGSLTRRLAHSCSMIERS